MTDNDMRSRRPLRSYVLRGGRMTAGQQHALDEHWSTLGLNVGDGMLDSRQVFKRDAPVVLEIGFGMGDSLLQMAQQQPGVNFVGVEVHGPGVGRLLMGAQQHSLDNLRLYQHDAVEVLQQCIPDQSLAGVQIYFPDPWHKKKHHKRRLLQASFVALLVRKLRVTGYLHAATDWEEYAQQIMEVLAEHPALRNRAGWGQYSARPEWRPETKFERRGARLGHGVWDLLFDKVDSSSTNV
jgi:tRNA (guanine-N7-)-methyltransferase